jgi:tetratricopeptide (TPR) repeat protein
MQRVESVARPICKTVRLSFSIRAFSVATVLLLTCAASRAQSADDLIEKGDVFALKFQADEALKDYLPAEKMEPKNVRLLVRISREYRHLMSDASKTEEKLRLGGIAVDYAKRAAALGPNDPEAQLAVAISYGKLQPLASTKEKVETARIIKSEADKAIKLDPRSDLAWHVLGRWNMGYAEITGVKRTFAELVYGKLPAPTYEDAAKCFEKAIELKPDRLIHYIELGLVYSRMGRTADARHAITKGLAMKETEKDDPETKQRGREMLAMLR